MAVIDHSEEKIIDKIRKLLRLSENNPDIEEAKSAAAKAQELIARYNVQQAFLKLEQDDATGVNIEDTYIHQSGRVATWIRVIAYTLSEANNCAMYYTQGEGINCVGEPDDIALTRVILDYLISEVKNLCKRAVAKRNADLVYDYGYGMDKSQGRVYANNFKLGAANSLNERIKATIKKVEEETAAHPQGQYALTIISNKLVRSKQHLPKLTKGPKIRYRGNRDAYAKGREAGKKISLSPNRLRG